MVLSRLALIALLALAACDEAKPSPSASPLPSAVPSSGPSIVPSVVPTAPSSCPVTLPGSAGEPPFEKGALFGSGSSYGNNIVWVGGLGDGGVVQAEAGGNKFGWYRIAEGTLTITGRRLDGQAPPLESHVPEGYGTVGFQSSGLTFPAAGCWEITGHVGTGSMTFVTYVVK